MFAINVSARCPEHSSSCRTSAAALTVAGLLALVALPVAGGEAAEKPKERPIRIAMVESLFRDSPRGLAKPIVEAFGALVRAQTGLDTEIVPGSPPMILGRKLTDNEVQLGVFQGVEFAWARTQYPELKPLMVIINTTPVRHGVLVVRADSKWKGFADLKDKSICVPLHSRLHCDLFLEQGCGGTNPNEFCSRISHPPNSEDALDDLVDGTDEAAVVDAVALESYRRRKPARFARLKTLEKSAAFPPSVIAYRPGRIDAKRLKQFQDGLLKSNETVLGRHLLMLWRMSAFETTPADLDKRLEEIIKVHPAPKEEAEKH